MLWVQFRVWGEIASIGYARYKRTMTIQQLIMYGPPIAVSALVAVGIVWMNLAARSEWSPHRPLDGQLVMRRKVNGVWEYREPTSEEINDDEWWWAIK